MYCPKCGANQSEELRFCNLCGANLLAVRQVVDSRDAGEKLDWNKTWMAEMLLTKEERRRRGLEREVKPEVKRQNEIKGGIITSCAGIALMIFLYVLMQGIIIGGKIPSDTAEILRRVWVAGVFPFFVGIGLLINGLFVSKKLLKETGEESVKNSDSIEGGAERPALRSADTTEFITPEFSSVTEGTTKHLKEAGRKQQSS